MSLNTLNFDCLNKVIFYLPLSSVLELSKADSKLNYLVVTLFMKDSNQLKCLFAFSSQAEDLYFSSLSKESTKLICSTVVTAHQTLASKISKQENELGSLEMLHNKGISELETLVAKLTTIHLQSIQLETQYFQATNEGKYISNTSTDKLQQQIECNKAEHANIVSKIEKMKVELESTSIKMDDIENCLDTDLDHLKKLSEQYTKLNRN